jgi:hypothetical protein
MNHIADNEVSPCTLRGIDVDYDYAMLRNEGGYSYVPVEDYRPYLLPMSSMTEEQQKEYYSLADNVSLRPGEGTYFGIKIHCIKLGISDNPHEGLWDYVDLEAIDWLNKHHYDYRGLIKKGLAIDCTNLNIY